MNDREPRSTPADQSDLARRLEEAEETLRAIQDGAVDAFVVAGDRIYTLEGADHTYRRFVEEMQEGAATLNADGTIAYCNKRFADLVRMPHEKALGARMESLIVEQDRPRFHQLRSAGPDAKGSETWLRAADGSCIPVLLTFNAMPRDSGAAIGLLVTDLTIQKKHETDLKASMTLLGNAERLAALGNMAAGLGHDIGNIVLPIRARLEVLARGDTATLDEDVRQIGDALTHLTNLSAGLRLMALDPRRADASPPALNLRKWWAEAQSVLQCCMPQSIILRSEIDDHLSVAIARHQLTQIIFNLVQNAGEALSGGSAGAVTVRAHAAPAPADCIAITVSDNGPGIAPEHLARCFEPYFSTKGRAIATGMGLAMVRGMVETAGGSVSVRSELGKGATFTIILPSSNGSPCTSRPRAAISLTDARALSLARATLKGMDVDVMEPAGGQRGGGIGELEDKAPEADIWIVQNPSSVAIETFLSRASHRSMVVLGDEAPISPRIHRLATGAPLSALREAIVLVADQERAAKKGDAPPADLARDHASPIRSA